MHDVNATLKLIVGSSFFSSILFILIQCIYHFLQRSQAIERWGSMRETTNKHFKMTPRTSFYAILWAGLVPFGLLTLIKWDTRRRDLKKGVKPREHF